MALPEALALANADAIPAKSAPIPVNGVSTPCYAAAQSRTVQSSVVQGATAVGGAVAALSSLDGPAQIVVLGGAVIGERTPHVLDRGALRGLLAGCEEQA